MDADQSSYAVREANWRLCTKAGNQEMQQHRYAEAQRIYKQALTIAESLLAEAKFNPKHPDAIHPYVVSHNNLMDAYVSLNQIELAETTLQQVYTTVVAMMNNQSLPSKLRLESFKALKIVASEMYRFYRDLNQITKAEALFAQITQQAQSFLAEFDFTSLEELQPDQSVHSRYSLPD